MSISASLMTILAIVLFAQAASVVRYALKGQEGEPLTVRVMDKLVGYFCQWQASMITSVQDRQQQPEAASPVPDEDPKWKEFYIPTYQRLGRPLSFERAD